LHKILYHNPGYGYGPKLHSQGYGYEKNWEVMGYGELFLGYKRLWVMVNSFRGYGSWWNLSQGYGKFCQSVKGYGYVFFP